MNKLFLFYTFCSIIYKSGVVYGISGFGWRSGMGERSVGFYMIPIEDDGR